MAEFPALPLFTDALLGDTMHLSTRQFGAYMLMLIVAWRTNDCALPNDDQYLARITRLEIRTWNLEKSTLLAFWKVNETGKLIQGRLKDERSYVEDKRQRNVHAGKVSALKRKERHSTTVPTKHQQEPNQPTPTPTPTKEKEAKASLKKKPKTLDEPEGFATFWQDYPRQRRGARPKAINAYKQALKRSTQEEIHEGLIRYAASREVKDGFAKNCAGWLNDDRFKTDYSIRPGNQPHNTGTRTPPPSFTQIAIDLANDYKANRNLPSDGRVHRDKDGNKD